MMRAGSPAASPKRQQYTWGGAQNIQGGVGVNAGVAQRAAVRVGGVGVGGHTCERWVACEQTDVGAGGRLARASSGGGWKQLGYSMHAYLVARGDDDVTPGGGEHDGGDRFAWRACMNNDARL